MTKIIAEMRFDFLVCSFNKIKDAIPNHEDPEINESLEMVQKGLANLAKTKPQWLKHFTCEVQEV